MLYNIYIFFVQNKNKLPPLNLLFYLFCCYSRVYKVSLGVGKFSIVGVSKGESVTNKFRFNGKSVTNNKIKL